jgi:hypothetical protein
MNLREILRKSETRTQFPQKKKQKGTILLKRLLTFFGLNKCTAFLNLLSINFLKDTQDIELVTDRITYLHICVCLCKIDHWRIYDNILCDIQKRGSESRVIVRYITFHVPMKRWVVSVV